MVGFQLHVAEYGAEAEAPFPMHPGILFPFTRKVIFPGVFIVAVSVTGVPLARGPESAYD